MKYLIVNADDYGASRGINRGILEAHRRGILTSTSLLVNTAWSGEAAEMSSPRAVPADIRAARIIHCEKVVPSGEHHGRTIANRSVAWTSPMTSRTVNFEA